MCRRLFHAGAGLVTMTVREVVDTLDWIETVFYQSNEAASVGFTGKNGKPKAALFYMIADRSRMTEVVRDCTDQNVQRQLNSQTIARVYTDGAIDLNEVAKALEHIPQQEH